MATTTERVIIYGGFGMSAVSGILIVINIFTYDKPFWTLLLFICMTLGYIGGSLGQYAWLARRTTERGEPCE